jgi:hypothetical protein
MSKSQFYGKNWILRTDTVANLNKILADSQQNTSCVLIFSKNREMYARYLKKEGCHIYPAIGENDIKRLIQRQSGVVKGVLIAHHYDTLKSLYTAALKDRRTKLAQSARVLEIEDSEKALKSEIAAADVTEEERSERTKYIETTIRRAYIASYRDFIHKNAKRIRGIRLTEKEEVALNYINYKPNLLMILDSQSDYKNLQEILNHEYELYTTIVVANDDAFPVEYSRYFDTLESF